MPNVLAACHAHDNTLYAYALQTVPCLIANAMHNGLYHADYKILSKWLTSLSNAVRKAPS